MIRPTWNRSAVLRPAFAAPCPVRAAIWCAFAALLPTVAFAQGAPESAPPPRRAAQGGPVLEDRVDRLLKEWCRRTEGIQSFYIEFATVERDIQFGDKIFKNGAARFLRLGPKKQVARLDMRQFEKSDPKDPTKPFMTKKGPVLFKDPGSWPALEAFVLTERREVWHIDYRQRKATIFPDANPALTDQGLGDGPLPFLMCGDPDKAKARYFFKILAEDERSAQVEIEPRLEDDKGNFVLARVVLDKANFLPTELYIKEPNGNDSDSKLGRRDIDIPLEAKDFVVNEADLKQRGYAIQLDQRGRADGSLKPAGGAIRPQVGNRNGGETPRR